MPICLFAKKKFGEGGGGGAKPPSLSTIGTPFHGTKLKLRHILREVVIANYYLVELYLSIFRSSIFTKDEIFASL